MTVSTQSETDLSVFAIRLSEESSTAKHYGAAKEYLEILLKPFFCASRQCTEQRR